MIKDVIIHNNGEKGYAMNRVTRNPVSEQPSPAKSSESHRRRGSRASPVAICPVRDRREAVSGVLRGPDPQSEYAPRVP